MSRIIIIILITLTTVLRAQEFPQKGGKQFSLLFGLNQPLVLKGFNAEVNFWTKKVVIDYSHGVGLNVSAKLLSKEYEVQKVNL